MAEAQISLTVSYSSMNLRLFFNINADDII